MAAKCLLSGVHVVVGDAKLTTGLGHNGRDLRIVGLDDTREEMVCGLMVEGTWMAREGRGMDGKGGEGNGRQGRGGEWTASERRGGRLLILLFCLGVLLAAAVGHGSPVMMFQNQLLVA